jgi:hypothetical protein
MTRAEILRARIVKLFEARGVSFESDPANSDRSSHTALNYDNKILAVRDVYRHNGTAENCSVEIVVYRVVDGWRHENLYESGKITEKIGARALKNRIEAALEKYEYSGSAPADEGLRIFFESIE